MMLRIVMSVLVAVTLVVGFGIPAFATSATINAGSVATFGTPAVSVKTSPNVIGQYLSPGTGAANTTYVAGTVHAQGDKAYGVDPDYSGTYTLVTTVGQTAVPSFPSAATAGSTGDFSGWTAK